MPRLKAKVDDNHKNLTRVFRQLGCSVYSTHQLGKGFPDLCCAIFGRTFLVEIKDGSKVPSQRKLTPDEIAFHGSWKAPVYIIESDMQAAALVMRIRDEVKYASQQ